MKLFRVAMIGSIDIKYFPYVAKVLGTYIRSFSKRHAFTELYSTGDSFFDFSAMVAAAKSENTFCIDNVETYFVGKRGISRTPSGEERNSNHICLLQREQIPSETNEYQKWIIERADLVILCFGENNQDTALAMLEAQKANKKILDITNSVIFEIAENKNIQKIDHRFLV